MFVSSWQKIDYVFRKFSLLKVERTKRWNSYLKANHPKSLKKCESKDPRGVEMSYFIDNFCVPHTFVVNSEGFLPPVNVL